MTPTLNTPPCGTNPQRPDTRRSQKDRDRDREQRDRGGGGGGDRGEVDRLRKDLQRAQKESGDARRSVALAEADVKRLEDRIRSEAREKERLEQKVRSLRRYVGRSVYY